MISQAVHDAIKRAIDAGDFRSLHDYFADDVELKIAMAVGSPGADEHCKRPVIEYLQKLGDFDTPPDGEPPEFFANGDRVVAFWDESVLLKSGVAIRSQCTLVFDVRDGLITRLAIHHDLSPVRPGRPERRARPEVAGSTVHHGQRTRAVGRAPADFKN
jgi:ketosteroid isomerase-like protein